MSNQSGFGAGWPAPPPVSSWIWKMFCSATSPYESVTSAKYRPRMRSDTPPSTSAWAPPMAAAARTPTQNDWPCTVTMYADVKAPMPTNAWWPSEIWPT